MSEIPAEIKNSIASIQQDMSKLLIEIAVNEEKMNNKVSEVDLEKGFRKLEGTINTELTTIKVDAAKRAGAISIVISIIIGLAMKAFG